jgi:GNAT superfamily N-acetyltransferase
MSPKYYIVEYKMSSSLDDDSSDNYISCYNGNIIEKDIDTEQEYLIGKLELNLIHLSRAYDNNFSIPEIFDYDKQIMSMAKYIYDIEQADFNNKILNFFDNVYVSSDICLLRQIEIVESHRGKGVGTKVIKDIFDRFCNCCGLFVVEAYPMQFNSETTNRLDTKELAWAKRLNYDALSKDFEKSFYKLKAFYQKSGFHHIEGFDEWMFINPGIRM